MRFQIAARHGRVPRRVAGVALLSFALTVVSLLAAEAARAHGAPSYPAARTYACYFLAPQSPLCDTAWRANAQALYDWMEVNIGNADGRHQELIPDGKLCSANRDKYAAFDTPSNDWLATPVEAGPLVYSYRNTAPHATLYYRVYLTKEGFDPTKPLKWSDLQLIHDTGPRPRENDATFTINMPQRTGRHILYTVWQRSDSPEAFYSCSDVTYGPGPVLPEDTTPQPPTGPPPPQPPAQPAMEAEVSPMLETTSDWGTGYCVNATVSNHHPHPIKWVAKFPFADTMGEPWSATIEVANGIATAKGVHYNDVLEPHHSTSFGYCATRTGGSTNPPAPPAPPPPAPTPPPPPAPTPPPPAPPTGEVTYETKVTSDWGTGYCLETTVRNGTNASVTWEAILRVGKANVTSSWDAKLSKKTGDDIVVTGASWNKTVASGQTTTFGLCASGATPNPTPVVPKT